MSFGFVGTKDGATRNLNITYNVVYASSTTFKVSLQYILNGKSRQATIWALKNGTVLALYAAGTNSTGSAASTTVLGYFNDLQTLNVFALQDSTITSYFHSTGTSTVSIGSNSFTVTNYVANTTPETVQLCNSAGSAVLSAYNVNVGTPSGSSLELVTSANFDASITTPSGTTTLEYEYQVLSFTVA